jgi:Cu(I)/Ag(I) efflux system membrane fusion protein
MNRTFQRVLWALLLVLAACGQGDPPPAAPPGHDHGGGAADGAPEAEYYTCPMHPSVKSEAPGRCPICGMDLVPVVPDPTGSVMIDQTRRDAWGIRTVAAESRPLVRQVRLAGPVGWDLRRQRDVVVKATGTVSDLRVSVGTPVRAGDSLFWLRSPELFAAQSDFLGMPAESRASGGARLLSLGLTQRQVDGIAASGTPLVAVPILAPTAGVVTDLSVVNGSPLEGWTAPVRIADADRVWVEASSAESEAALVGAGAEAVVTVDALPGRTFQGIVTPIPSVDAAVQRFRVEIPNADGVLRPGLVAIAEVTIETPATVIVPADAVIYAGFRRIVFVDVGGGKLERREVTIAARDDDEVSLQSGVLVGDLVVRDGNFLVAADSRLRTPAAWAPAPPTLVAP